VPRRVLILGSTGSIGTQVLDVCARLGDRVRVVGLAAHSNAEALACQAAEWKPDWLGLVEGAVVQEGLGGKVLVGPDAHARLAQEADYDVLVVSVSGMIGLEPTMIALRRGKTVALASKEVLVSGGEEVTRTAAQSGRIVPIDSEHSAVFQCMQAVAKEDVAEIILTASGGPFRGWSRERLQTVTAEQALAHPTWRMGPKITVDSATLMNKGLEVIEARWLFGLPADRITVVVHPQSIIHSMIRTRDGSVLAQMGLPDMRLPIQVALLDLERVNTGLPVFDPLQCTPLTFEPVDRSAFPCLDLAYEAARLGGTMPAVMNGANEAAVPMFLEGRIGFTEIAEVVRRVMDEHCPVEARLDAVLEADAWARETARKASCASTRGAP
jgi:1-deoxy-D-xylulose-5-phosphate reductoisomerase